MRPTFVYFDRNSPVLDETTSHHVAKVLRKSVGDSLTGFDGNGGVYELQIEEIQKRTVRVRTLSESLVDRSGQELSLVLSGYRPQRLEVAMEKCTELGVLRFILTETDYSSISLSHLSGKSSRFETIIRQACLQSEQPWFPELSFVSFDDVLAMHHSHAWIGVTQEISQEEVRPFSAAESQAILIGPEGGFSEVEVARAFQAGFVPTQPFQTILRSETAAIAFTSLVQSVHS